jgi:acetoin utilization deacetylase AcuC-like enzyme
MGFCIFNNAAIAAAAARAAGAERVAILDWDVHHGNGTQHAFQDRRDVLYLSSHRYPFYPGTGAINEIGRGDGAGFTVNVPLPGGRGDGDLTFVFDEVFVPVLRQYRPDLVILSAGYDAHASDPLGGMAVTDLGFQVLARKIRAVAEATCDGRIVAMLEGGYDVDALGRACTDLVSELAAPAVGDAAEVPPRPARITEQIIAEVQRTLSKHWGF